MSRIALAVLAANLMGCQLNDTDYQCIETLGKRDVAAFCGGVGNHLEVPVNNDESLTVMNRQRGVLVFASATSNAPTIASVQGPVCSDSGSDCQYYLNVHGGMVGTATITLVDSTGAEIDEVPVPVIQ
jgi:hypothetical protein